jgi:hypothetical protein
MSARINPPWKEKGSCLACTKAGCRIDNVDMFVRNGLESGLFRLVEQTALTSDVHEGFQVSSALLYNSSCKLTSYGK